MQPTDRFSSRADAYIRGRPTYPVAIVEQLESVGALKAGSAVVDLGVGTGLSAEPFLQRGYTVTGIEPNADMRAAGDQYLREFSNYRSIEGSSRSNFVARGGCRTGDCGSSVSLVQRAAGGGRSAAHIEAGRLGRADLE